MSRPPLQLALLDAIGPFFRGLNRRRINWSKIPFADLPTDEDGADAFWERLRADMADIAGKALEMGFNAITLDDVAHLVVHPDYEPELRRRTAFLAGQFQGIVKLFQAAGLKVFVTSDFLVASPGVIRKIGSSRSAARNFYLGTLGLFFESFPHVDGVILRVGESDGVDVRDPLCSHLAAKSAPCVNRLLRHVLPLFERLNKTLIFRTWTVGAFAVGDLIWHRGRLRGVLEGIHSPALVVSMKPGESDFFRYLPLNRQFFRTDLPKIIELQARREYEGAGEFPSFCGWEFEKIAGELKSAGNVIGISVWCQTGGWHRFRRLTFLGDSSVWVEMNVVAAMEIFQRGGTAEDAIAKFFGPGKAGEASEFLRLADDVIRRLLYIEGFATQKLFFRRVRIPPLIHVFWDCVLVVEPVREILKRFVEDQPLALCQGEEAFAHFSRMRELASNLDLPVEDIDFMRDSMEMVLLARRFYFQSFTPETADGIEAAKSRYKALWPSGRRPRYRIKTSFEPSALRWPAARWLLRLVLRRRRGYRTVLDRFFTLTLLSWSYRLVVRSNPKAVPKTLRKAAMGVDAVIR